MSKLSIVEVFDPFINEFINVDEAISRGIFNEENYEYNDYVNNKKFSVTDAVKRGFFRTEVHDDFEDFIDEKLLVTQTFEIVKAADPFNRNVKLELKEAIKRGIVDLKENLYRDLKRKKDYSLNDAIQKKLIQVNLIDEQHEKRSHTFTKNFEDIQTILPKDLREGNDIPVVKKEDHINLPSALVKDLDNNCFVDIEEAVEIGLFNKSNALYYDAIHLSDAIEVGNIILPNSDYLVNNIEYVKDVETAVDMDINLAIERGIIDKKKKLFLNSKINQKISLFEALYRGFLILHSEEFIIKKTVIRNFSEISHLKKNSNLIPDKDVKPIMRLSSLDRIEEDEEISNNIVNKSNIKNINEDQGYLMTDMNKNILESKTEFKKNIIQELPVQNIELAESVKKTYDQEREGNFEIQTETLYIVILLS